MKLLRLILSFVLFYVVGKFNGENWIAYEGKCSIIFYGEFIFQFNPIRKYSCGVRIGIIC